MVRMISWRAVAEGAAVGVVSLVALAGLSRLALGEDPAAGWNVVFALAAVFALLAAGFVAGRRRLDLPMVHGALAAVGAAVFTVAVQLAIGGAELSDLTPSAVALTIVLGLVAGVGGALLADWVHRRRQRSQRMATLVGTAPDDRNRPSGS